MVSGPISRLLLSLSLSPSLSPHGRAKQGTQADRFLARDLTPRLCQERVTLDQHFSTSEVSAPCRAFVISLCYVCILWFTE